MWFSENLGKFVNAKSFRYDEVIYPATTFRHPEVLEGATIYPLQVEKVNTRYYTKGAMTRTFANGVWMESCEAIPKDLEELRKELVKDNLISMDLLLSRTDRFLTRKDEMANYFSKWAINPSVSAWRGEVYQLFNDKLNSITEAATFDDLIEADKSDLGISEHPVELVTPHVT